MPHRIEVKSKIPDGRAKTRQRKLKSAGFNVGNVEIVDAYTIDADLTPEQLQETADSLINPVVETATIGEAQRPDHFDAAIEVGFKAGVKDNVGTTVKDGIEDLIERELEGQVVHSSQVTFVDLHKEAQAIADALHNPIIQRTDWKPYLTFIEDGGMDTYVPRVKLEGEPKADVIDILGSDDDELRRIGKLGIFDHDRKISDKDFEDLRRDFASDKLKLGDIFERNGENFERVRRGPLALLGPKSGKDPIADLSYMHAIKNYFAGKGRNPTDIELESIAQTWSEHCKHTIFADPIDDIEDGLFKHHIKRATETIRKQKGSKDFCVSVFTDNSGAIAFDDKWLITHKVETHNTPSALDPFGGSITGIVGVNRDAIGFGMGAKPVINTYGFCFGDPKDVRPLYKGKNNTQKMLSPKRILEGVIEGVNSGGNCSGISTPQGFVLFDERYRGKPLVFVGTVGLIPREINGKPSHIKKAQPGDHIVMLGGRVGKDGIHGATFSSEAMDTGSPVTAVQIGDPITQKKTSDAVIFEARDRGLYHSITDNGAGGLSCSVAEMARESGGCFVTLDKVPLKYPGMQPWEIWVSESQERMTLAVPPEKWEEFSALMKSRDVEATCIGLFTNTGNCTVDYNGKTVMDIDLKFLHDDLPKRPMTTTYTKPVRETPTFAVPADLSVTVSSMLGRLNIASFEFISQQYDHEVQGGCVIKPLQGRGRVNGDATVTRPVLDSMKGVVLSQGVNPWYSEIDAYNMAACAIDTAIRNAVVTGADIDNLALLDNFCWCSSNDPERLGQLKAATTACYDYSIAYNTPFISGKDSMFNDFKGFDENGNPINISVPPTLLISSIGVIEDSRKAISLDAKFEGDLVYVLGETHDELAGTEYAAMMGEAKKGFVPEVNARKNKKLYRAFTEAVDADLVASAQSVHRGGLAVALAKTSMGGRLGMEVSLEHLPGTFTREDYALFSESQGRIVVTVAPQFKDRFEAILQGNVFAQVGEIKGESFVIKGRKGGEIARTDVNSMLDTYKALSREFE